METFEYRTPASVVEVLEEIADSDGTDTILWAGGTATALLMKQRLITPKRIVSLDRVGELGAIRQPEDGSFTIGARVHLQELHKSLLVQQLLPVLSDTAGLVGNVRVRNAATLGGHLVHADPAQDLPPLLLVLDAEVNLVSQTGERQLALREFFVDTMETAIRPDELLSCVIIPPIALSWKSRYVKFTPRSRDDYATVGVAASVGLADDGHTVEEVRIAVSGAGTTAKRLSTAESVLVGHELSDDRCRRVAQVVEHEVEPWDDARGSAAYKRAMAATWTERVLCSLRGGG